mmetsp:Transcript_26146/g.43143  ORF Transcript_26146/g.43143 Transcript_26146/m.43143 type:complete len:96 (+) Transcript_26146:120-407(+)
MIMMLIVTRKKNTHTKKIYDIIYVSWKQLFVVVVVVHALLLPHHFLPGYRSTNSTLPVFVFTLVFFIWRSCFLLIPLSLPVLVIVWYWVAFISFS